MRKRCSGATVALTVLLLLFRSNAHAQNGTGEISGRVADMASQAVRDAIVTVTNVDTGGVRRTTTDASGRFAFPLLPPAHYQVTAMHSGYAGRRQDDIVLLPDARMAITLQLREALLAETIALNPYPPILEPTRTHSSAFVADTEIHDLPVIGLRYLRLARLTPAVSSDAATGGLSVMDFPSNDNRLVVDGFDQTSTVTGEPLGREGPGRVPYQVALTSIDAYRINTNAAPAAFGGTAASVVDVATKAGTNEFHGIGYEFFGDRALNGETLLDDRAAAGKPAYRNNQFGALIGGPMVTNRAFYLLSVDALRRTAAPSATLVTAPFTPVGSAASDVLQLAFARTPRDERQDLLQARTDYQLGSQRATLRYNDQQFTGAPIDSLRMQPSFASDGIANLRTRFGGASLNSALGGHVVNEARVQYATVHDGESVASMPGAVVLQDGSFVGQMGSSLYGPHVFTTRRFEFSDHLSLVAGGHSLTIGGDALHNRNRLQFLPSTTRGFQTIPHFVANTPDWMTRTFDTGPLPVNVADDSAYVQDTWRASGAVTVDLGARYDLQQFSTSLPRTDRNNWAPRIGVAISPGGHTHLFRAAYGLMYGTTPALIPALAEAYESAPWMVAIDPSFTAPRVHQASAGWEFEKYRTGTIGVDYLFARGEHLARAVQGNVLGGLPASDMIAYESTGNSLYNGITLHVRARVLQQLFYTVAYTFSRLDETPLDPLAPVVGGPNDRFVLARSGANINTRAPGSTDQRHNLSLSTLYNTSLFVTDRRGLSRRLFEDWNVGLVWTLQSGQPYSAFVNGDLNGDGNPFNDLAPGTSWNQYRLPWQAEIDPRVSRQFSLGGTRRLALIWEAFNVANRPNYTSVDDIMSSLSGNTLVPNPQFRRKTGETAGRMMQLAAKFTF
jgi:hypothetical protein